MQNQPSETSITRPAGRARAAWASADAAARLQLVLTASEIGTWLWDVVHDVVEADANLAAMFGLSEEEALGAPLAVITRAIHPEDRAKVMAAVAHCLAEGSPYELEYRLLKPDGSVRWVLARGRVGYDSDGKPASLPGVVLDITDRHVLTEKVAQQSRIFDTTLSSITDFAYIFDKAGRFVYVNQALLSLWGLPLEQAVGKNFFDLQYPDALAAKLQRQIRHVLETGEQIRDETPYTSPTGAGGFYEYIFSAVRGLDGTIEVVAGSTRDITTRKAVELAHERLQVENAQLLTAERNARADAERLSQAKDEFLATLSHELRTPLNAILGWAQILRVKAPDDAALAQGLTIIERNAHVQRRLIEDLLDMSRIISGKVCLEVQRIDLGDIITTAVQALRPAAEAKQIRITTVLDTTGGALWGDANRLQQVIWNLLSNATKFTPKGGTIEVIQQRVGSCLDVTIRDNGQGIDPLFLPVVFDRFRQSDASTTRTHGGLGLGLAIVKTLVELHGGRVMATSAGLGQGAAFTVSLPQTISDPSPHVSREIPAEVAVHDPPLTRIAPELLRNVKVLVVDDNADGRDVIARILREAGAEVLLASSATAALDLFARDRPDVLLSDIGMPDIDGYELMRRIRVQGSGQKPAPPAAALTALARPEDRTRALLAGYQTHIAKPVDATELIAAVAALAGRTGAA